MSLRRFAKVSAPFLIAACLASCAQSDDVPPVTPSPNVGAGWVSITSPAPPQASTEFVSIYMAGDAFISPSNYRCCTGSATDTGVTVSWTNTTTGATGSTNQTVQLCWLFGLFLCNHRWYTDVPVSPGSNSIAIRAFDAAGNIGTASITISRNPDLTPPTVTTTSPVNQAQGIPIDANVSATFSEPMNPATINGAAFVLEDSNENPVASTVTYAGTTATLDPIGNLASSSVYTATISTVARDLAGNNPLTTDVVWTFTTGANLWQATSTSGAPSYSLPPTAVWTGTEMIVWGATTTGPVGAKYNPATDTWLAITSVGAPSARSSHHAIWTGSDMIVWGGFQQNPLAQVNTGGRYNPTTNLWQPMSTVNAPSPRMGATTVWTGIELIVWGGSDATTSAILNDGASYNPPTDTWQPLTTNGAPSGRVGHTAVWTGTEMVVWGGFDETASWTNTGGRYNTATASWRATTSSGAPEARSDHTVVWTGQDMVVWGGTSGAVGNLPLNTGGRYNPVIDRWAATTTVGSPSARVGHTVIWSGSEMIIWGGTSASLPTNSGGRYNPLTNLWSSTGTTNAPSARSGHTSVWTGTTMIAWGPLINTGGRYTP